MPEQDDFWQRYDEQRSGTLDSVLGEAIKKDAAKTAQASGLAARTGVPVETVERNFDEVRQMDRRREIDAKKIAEKDPTLSEFLQDIRNASQAHDDIDNLSTIGRALRSGADLARSVPEGAVFTYGSTLEGLSRANAAASRFIIRGLDKVLPDAAIEALEAPVLPWWANPTGLLQQQGQSAKSAAEAIGPPEERKNLATDIAHGVGQMGTQIAMMFANPTVGASALFAQGVDQQGERQERQGVEGESVATDAALIAGGAVTFMAERTGLDLILNRLPPAIKNRIMRQLVDVTMAGGIEALEEAIEGVAHGGIEAAFYNPDAELFEGIEREAMAAGGTGAVVRGIINAITPGKQRLASEIDSQRIETVNRAAELSKLRENNPEKFREYMESLADETGTDTVYLDAEATRLYFQGDVDPALLEQPAIAAIVEDIPAAIEEGRDIEVSLAGYATDIVGTDIQTALQTHMRIDPDALTADELASQDTEQQIADIIEQDMQEREEIDAVYQDMLGQLVGTEERSTAESDAFLWHTVFESLAQRPGIKAAGLSPMELYQRYNPTVGREVDPRLQRRAQAIENVDVMLDRLRAGDLPREQDIFGQSIIPFIISKGGINDEGGELAARDADVGRVGANRLARKEGRSLDDVAEYLSEEGFIEERDMNLVLEAIDRELGGESVYRLGGENAELQGVRDSLLELDEILGRAGLDVQTMSNEEIRAAMEQQVSDTAFSQIRAPVAEEQDFGDTTLDEDVTIQETGEDATITRSAQRRFDQTMKRRQVVDQVRRCLNG